MNPANRLLRHGLIIAAICAVPLAGLRAAQDAVADRSADPVARVAAEEAVRIAILDLRLVPEPTPDDYRITRLLLREFSELLPGDIELLRRRVAAAWAEGDREAAIAATRELLRQDPADTVAQLRLIADQLQQQGTVESRLAAAERYLGPRGDGLDAAVRSRIAVDAALLAREVGDPDAFGRFLAQAIALDRTNKDAASLALNFYRERLPDDRLGHVQLMLNLLAADPVDPQVYVMLSRSLASIGAYDAARLYMSLGDILIARASGEPSPQLDIERLVLNWHAEGPEAVVSELSRRLAVYRAHAEQMVREFEAAETPLPPGFIMPDDVRLSVEETELLALAAHAAVNDQVLVRALEDLRIVTTTRLEELLAQADLGGPDAQQAILLWHRKALDFVRVACLARPKDPEAAARTARVAMEAIKVVVDDVQFPGPFDDEQRAWRAWLRGDLQGAITGFRTAPRVSRWWAADAGLALGLAAAGEPEEAFEVVVSASAEAATDAYSAWMRTFAVVGLGVEPVDQALRARAERDIGGIPRWIGEACQQPASFQRLRAELEPGGRVRVEIFNKAPGELGVGSDRPIATPIMLSPRVTIGMEGRPDVGLPEVYDLSRRLRLQPREGIGATLDPQRGGVQWLLDATAYENRRLRWQVHQGYRVGSRGIFESGPMSLGTMVESIELPRIVETSWSAAELAEAAGTAGGQDLIDLASAVRALALAPLDAAPRLSRDELTPIAEAFATRYPQLDRASRLLLQAVLPNARKSPAFAVFDEAALAEQDPLIALVAAVARADEPDELARLMEAAGDRAEAIRLLGARAESRGGGFAAADRRLNGLGRISEIMLEVEAERERLRGQRERERE